MYSYELMTHVAFKVCDGSWCHSWNAWHSTFNALFVSCVPRCRPGVAGLPQANLLGGMSLSSFTIATRADDEGDSLGDLLLLLAFEV